MAGSLNKVMLIGNLGADPEVRPLQHSDGSLASLRLATNERWNDRNGQPQERTEWHRVVVFGKLAEICKNYLHRGSKVMVEGQLRTRKWQDQSGTDRYTTEVVVSGYGSNIIMLDSREGGSRDRLRQEDEGGRHVEPSESQSIGRHNDDAFTPPDDLNDEIPF